MKISQEKQELTKMPEKELEALILDLQKEIVSKTVAAHKNELKNIRELRAIKKKLSRAKTFLWQKMILKEQA